MKNEQEQKLQQQEGEGRRDLPDPNRHSDGLTHSTHTFSFRCIALAKAIQFEKPIRDKSRKLPFYFVSPSERVAIRT